MFLNKLRTGPKLEADMMLEMSQLLMDNDVDRTKATVL